MIMASAPKKKIKILSINRSHPSVNRAAKEIGIYNYSTLSRCFKYTSTSRTHRYRKTTARDRDRTINANINTDTSTHTHIHTHRNTFHLTNFSI